MKKIINNPSNFIDEVIEGVLLAHSSKLKAVSEDKRAIVRVDAPVYRKVGIITGGGAGHLPLFLGYVGQGLLDGVAIGNVFTSPSPSQILAVANSVNSGQGVLLLYANYQGDILSFSVSEDLLNYERIPVETSLVTDDISSVAREKWENRRGIAGCFFAFKIAGALAQEGGDLPSVKSMADLVIANTCSMGVALSPGVMPESGRSGFQINPNEIEIGVGIHGERGIKRSKLLSADEITNLLMSEIIKDLPFRNGDQVAVLVNSLGSTPREELFIVNNRVSSYLRSEKMTIHRSYIGKFATSMEMAGISISLLRLTEKMKVLLDAPAETPFFTQL